MITYYSVISPRPELYLECEDMIKDNFTNNISLLIKENGKNGDHPHLNIIWEFNISRTNDVNQKIHRLLEKKYPQIASSSHLIQTKNITNLEMLIGGYLQKEDHYEVLLNTKYDLKTMKQKSLKFNYNKTKWDSVPICINFPYIYIQYCKDYNIPISEKALQFDYVLHHMTKIGNICVLHLLRREEEIIRILIYLLTDVPELFS